MRNDNNTLLPNEHLVLNKKVDLIKQFSNRVKKDNDFKRSLLRVVTQSASDSTLAVQAANAISILNAAGMSFAKDELAKYGVRSLTGIKIPGADLQGAVLSGTDLTNANLRGVNLFQATLQGTNFYGADVTDIKLGIEKIIQIDAKPTKLLLSPDNEWLVVSYYDGSFAIIKTQDFKLVKKIIAHKNPIPNIQFSRDSKLFCSCSDDIAIWDTNDWQEKLRIKHNPPFVFASDFSPNASLLCTGSTDGTLRFFDTRSGALVKTHVLDTENKPPRSRKTGHKAHDENPQDRFPIRIIRYSHDGKQLAVDCYKGVKLLDSESLQEIFSKSTQSEITYLTFDDNNDLLFSNRDQKLITYSTNRVEQSQTKYFTGNIESIEPYHEENAIFLTKDGGRFSPEGQNNELLIYDQQLDECAMAVPIKHNNTFATAPKKESWIAITSYNSNKILIYDILQTLRLHYWGDGVESFHSFTISDDLKFIAASSNENIIYEWDIETGERMKTYSDLDSRVKSLQYVNGRNFLCIALSDKLIIHQPLKNTSDEVYMEDEIERFMPIDQDRIAYSIYGNSGSWVKIMNLSNKQVENNLSSGRYPAFSCAYTSFNGGMIAVDVGMKVVNNLLIEKTLTVNYLNNYHMQGFDLESSLEDTYALIFSKDGNQLYCGGAVKDDNNNRYGQIEIFDMATRSVSHTLTNMDVVHRIVLSNDKQHLIVSGADKTPGTLYFWNNRSKKILYQYNPSSRIWQLKLSSDDNILVSAASTGKFLIWSRNYDNPNIPYLITRWINRHDGFYTFGLNISKTTGFTAEQIEVLKEHGHINGEPSQTTPAKTFIKKKPLPLKKPMVKTATVDKNSEPSFTEKPNVSVNPVKLIERNALQIRDQIGQGGFGLVYKGTWHGSDVAIKELKLQSSSPQAKDQFKNEIAIVASLQHPHIIQMFGCCDENTQLLLIMEYLVKGDISRYLHDKNYEMNDDFKIQMTHDIALGINILHVNGVIHRDLKPQNILFNSEWRCKITDFGLSAMLGSESVLLDYNKMGTLAYTPPEIILTEAKPEYRKSGDIYAFAMIMYEIITRSPPYMGYNIFQVMKQFIEQGKRQTIPPNTPKKLEQLLGKCWEKRREARPEIAEVMEELSQLKSEYKNIETPHQSIKY